MAEKLNLGSSVTRNSKLREKTARATASVAAVVDNKLPFVSPTLLNLLGPTMVGIGSSLAALRERADPFKEPGKTTLSGIFIVTGSLLDAIDGSLARRKDQKKPGSVDFNKGQIYDAIGDRTQEEMTALSRAASANKRGNVWGEKAALANAISGFFPSIARCIAEANGRSVAEMGESITGKLGTRVCRAAAGGLATIVPEFKGIPIQAVLDSLMVVSNLKTTADRLNVLKKEPIKPLPEEIRNQARGRLKALTAVGALALGATIFTCWRLNNKPDINNGQSKEKEFDLLKIMLQVEKYCQQNNLDHRFVGGALTDLIGPHTEFRIDVKNRTVQLINPNGHSLRRSSDDTVKDIDLVAFTKDMGRFLASQKEFKKWRLDTEERGLEFPNISVEAARHPDWPARNGLKQFVSAFEFDTDGKVYLVFDSLEQEISKKSLEPWTIDIGNGVKITTFNPVAHALCYSLRTPSGIKRKDLEPIGQLEELNGKPYSKIDLVNKLAHQVLAEADKAGADFKEEYADWEKYIRNLSNDPNILTRAKATITSIYWNTIGTSISHGAGLFKGLSTLSNRFTG